MEPKVTRLKLNIPKAQPLLSDHDGDLPQTVIPNGSVTAPVSNFHPHFLPRRFSVSSPRPENASKLSQALSRTFTLSSLMSSSIAVDEWKKIFDKLDLESDGKSNGKIPVNRFKEIIEDNPLWDSVPPDIQNLIMNNVEESGEKYVDFDAFYDLIRGNKFEGFTGWQKKAFRAFVKQTAKNVLPYHYQYQNQYSCSPPPVFILTMSLLQVTIFAYNSMSIENSNNELDQVSCSTFIFHPARRIELWRYLTYMFIHSGKFHLAFNVLAQLALGIPLEMVHGWWRVMVVYLFGIVAGSLWTSLLIPGVFLSGASSGVYALVTAHLATVIMNYREMTWPWSRMIFVMMVGLSDVVLYIYRQADGIANIDPVSYPAHISGAAIGLFAGITFLKNLHWERFERYIWAASLFISALLIGLPVVFSLANPDHFEAAVDHLNLSAVSCSSGPVIV